MAKQASACPRVDIGGQAVMEGVMMKAPDAIAIAVRRPDDSIVVKRRDYASPAKKHPWMGWPLVRGVVNLVTMLSFGMTTLQESTEMLGLMDEEPTKFEKWLEKVLGNEAFQKALIGIAVTMGLGLSILLFFLLPMVAASFFDRWIPNVLALNLVEGLFRILIFLSYMMLISRMGEMKRVFSYHGAEHKTIRCYESGLPLTVENVRAQTRLHPRCGTSFLLVIMVISILVFSAASSVLLALAPGLETMRGTFLFRLLIILFKLLLLPLVVGITYEINRWAGRHNNAFTSVLTAPGMWLQNFTTNEPDDGMIEVGIAALKAVLPEKEGADRW